MLWTPTQQFHPWPFDKEAELEAVIAEVKAALFGESRLYLDVKKLIGERGKVQNIPDGYLLDLSSSRKMGFPEQRGIVAKMDQLMALVDALETQLAASRATAANLLSAILRDTRH